MDYINREQIQWIHFNQETSEMTLTTADGEHVAFTVAEGIFNQFVHYLNTTSERFVRISDSFKCKSSPRS